MAPNGTSDCRKQIYPMCDCKHCPDSTWANHDSHMCVEICPNGTLPYKTSKDCVKKCPTGEVPKGGLLGHNIAQVPGGEDYQECQACEEGLLADREKEVCVEECPECTAENKATKECVKEVGCELASPAADHEMSLFLIE